MADLEEHAFRRDRRFIVRLVLALLVATLGGMVVYVQLTSRNMAGCAASVLSGEEPSEAVPGEPLPAEQAP